MKKHKLISQNLPKGRVIEIYGNVDVGKTRTALTVISELQDRTCLYIDVDCDLTKEKLLKYGIQDTVTVLQPVTIKQTTDIIRTFLDHDAIDIIVVDSTANLIFEESQNFSAGQQTYKKKIKALAVMIQSLIPLIEQKGTVLIFISQTRQDLNGNVYSTGGKALRFYSSVRLLITEDDIVIVKNNTDITLLDTCNNVGKEVSS